MVPAVGGLSTQEFDTVVARVCGDFSLHRIPLFAIAIVLLREGKINFDGTISKMPDKWIGVGRLPPCGIPRQVKQIYQKNIANLVQPPSLRGQQRLCHTAGALFRRMTRATD